MYSHLKPFFNQLLQKHQVVVLTIDIDMKCDLNIFNCQSSFPSLSNVLDHILQKASRVIYEKFEFCCLHAIPVVDNQQLLENVNLAYTTLYCNCIFCYVFDLSYMLN